MRTRILVATPVHGPLLADQLIAVLNAFRSIHQFQPFDQFSVVFVSETLTLQLDRGAMESIVEYMEGGNNHCRRTQFLRLMVERMTVRPVPEPEVLAAVPVAVEPEPEPIFEPTPKFIARVRFKLRNGRRIEETRAVDSLRELDYLLDHGPYADIRNIKIKLEIQR